MDYSDGASIGDEYPTGALIMDENKIFKVVRPLEKDGQKLLKQIGDFAIDIIAKGDKKYLININQKITLDNLNFTANLTNFKNYIRPYYFKGTADDLESIVSMMCQKINKLPLDNLIVIKDYVGLYEREDIAFWVFEDRIMITRKNEEELAIPEELLFGNQNILKIDDTWLSVDQSGMNRALIPVYKDPDGYSLKQFLAEFLLQVKNLALLYSCLGWIISSIYLERVNKLRKCRFFPFYVVTAGTEAGKTALLSNCIQMLGVSYTGENYAASVTRFVEMIEFARVSHLPIWRDEYKNEKYALDKESWIRSVYTRSNSSRGDKDQTTRSYPTRATLLLSGEDITEDAALARRMIKMRLNSTDKVSKEEHEHNTKNAAENFGKALPLILATPFDEKVFLDIYHNNAITNDTPYKDELMCYASFGAVFGKEEALKAIAAANDYHVKTKDDIINHKHVTAEDFFALLDSLFLEKGWYESLYNARPKCLDYFYCLPSKDTIYFKFLPLHQLLSKNRARTDYQWSKKALGQLITEAYNAKMEPRSYNGESNRVMIIDNVASITDVAGDLFHKIEMVTKKWETQQDSGYIPDL